MRIPVYRMKCSSFGARCLALDKQLLRTVIRRRGDGASVEAKVEELAARRVVFLRYEGMPQDAAGIWTSPSGAQVAWFKDPDGNNLSLTQFPKSG